ncbi:MAG TPA: molybdate ABC transporter permease subunit [Planktothrix sp.]
MTEIWFSIRLSLLVALLSTVIVALVGGTLGYILARFRFAGRNVLDALCTLPLVLPPTVVGFYLLGIFGRGGWLGHFIFACTGWSPVFTWQACVIAAVVISMPLMVKSSRAAFESVDQAYERVAYTLGRSRFETLTKVTIPLASKGLFAGIAMSFARALGEFGATLMLAGNIPGKTQTIPLAIYQATQSGADSTVFGLVVLLSVCSFFLLLLLNRWGAKW